MSLNVVIFTGNLTRDCEVKRTANGTDVVTFTIAVNEYRKDGNYANYFDCVWYGAGAMAVSPYLNKGIKVTVEGRLHQDRWENETGKHSRIVVNPYGVELPPKPKANTDDCPF